jgi:hypothetical protein
MKAHLRLAIFLLFVVVTGELVLRALRPWFSYQRAFLVCAVAFFIGGLTLLVLASRARAEVNEEHYVAPRVRIAQALLLFSAGIATLLFSRWAVHR